jgi:FAD/FMN-containing dehydrogenase
VTPASSAALRDAVDGPVFLPGDDGYDEVRLPWQRKFDPRPVLVAEPTGSEGVRSVVGAAREHDLPFGVQGTGHGSVRPADGGVLLRTSRMSDVEIDPAGAVARVAGGAVWRDVIEAAAPHGLGTLSGTSADVSVAGYTLGGGAGWLSRMHGYAADSVLSAELVTADGEVVTAGADENPDLFWALRGGSGNFGVVTELEFRLYPVGEVYSGMAVYDAERAADMLLFYREWALSEPDESNTSLTVMQLPPTPMVPEELRGRRVVLLRAFYAGPADAAERALAPLRDTGGTAVMDALRPMTFAEAATQLPAPPPMVMEMHTDMLDSVPDEVVAAVVEADPATGIEVRHWGGAMARPEREAGPLGHRDAPFSITASRQVPDRAMAGAARAAVDSVAAKVKPYATGWSFLNFLGDPSKTALAYTPEDYERLTEVKAAYDPDNFFSANHNIPPAA